MKKAFRVTKKVFKVWFLVAIVTTVLGSCKNLQNAFQSVSQASSARKETTVAQTESLPLSTISASTDVQTEHVLAPVYETLPQYEGSPCVDIQLPYDTRILEVTGIVLSPFDSLGRCGPAVMLAGPETLPTVGRESTGTAKPSGWHQNKYPGLVDSEPPYLYNRAHLLMWALSGLTDNRQNLITGTRYLNTEGMLPTELEVVKYIEKTGNHVIYRVTPVFEGDNLLASGVIMEAYGVEDRSFLIRRYAFNVQPGVEIDYATGENHLAGETKETVPQEKATYVFNVGTKKFHRPDCDSVKEMKPQHKKEFYGTRQEAIDMGYSPCGACSP